MPLQSISQADFIKHLKQVSQASFMQSPEMAQLLEKRSCQIDYLGYLIEGKLQVSALLYSLPMTGGLHMEINCGPIHTDSRYLSDFYKELQSYAKSKGALELIIKPYDTYQDFDSNGTPTSPEKPELIRTLTDLGYKHDGLQTGYPGGEPDWLYVKDLTGLTEANLLNSFSKKGKPLVKKANTFGIRIQRLEREQLHIFKEITAATSDRREYADKSLDYYQDFYDSFGANADFMIATLNFKAYLEEVDKGQEKVKQTLAELQEKLELRPNASQLHRQIKEYQHQFDSFEIRKKEAQELLTQYGDQDVVLAGSLFIYSQYESVYLFSGSYPEFNKFYAPALLQEYVMKESLKRGISFYNFLGIMGIFDGSDGVLRFKQNFNGSIVRKMGTFRYYPNPLKYQLIQGIKKILGR